MSTGIYKIENLINHKVYIGQSIHIEKRWQEHCRQSSNSLISQAIRKYGKNNFSFQVLEEVDDLNQLNNLETKYIQEYNSLIPYGYNVILIDDNQHHQFNKYNQQVFLEIIDTIKNSDLTFKEIAEKYNLDLSMVYYLNRGDYHTLPNENYPLRKVKDVSKQFHYCIDCGCEITAGATRCNKCSHIQQHVVEHPTRNILKQLIRSKSFVQIGKQFGVSDNAIRKWCKNYNLPYRASEIKQYTDSEWEKI